MSRDELLARQKQELHRLLGENNQRVIDQLEKHRIELLEHAIAGDSTDKALDVLTIVKAPFQREVKEGYPQSAEYEDAKFVLHAIDHAIEHIQEKYGK